MKDAQPTRSRSLKILRWISLGILILYFGLSSSFVWWPPAFIERHTQRQRLIERVQSIGGWAAVCRDCLALAAQNTNGFHSGPFNTNLPPAIFALKPREVQYDPRGGRIRMRIFGSHSTGGHSTPYLGLEVVTRKSDGYKPGEGYGGGVIGNYHSTFRRVADGIYEIY